MSEIRLVTFNPGHFHAALVQKEMYPGVSSTVHVYAPLGQDLLDHLGRISRFNARGSNPTRWELEVHAGPDALGRLIREKSGNVVVFSGRNRTKIDAVIPPLGVVLLERALSSEGQGLVLHPHIDVLRIHTRQIGLQDQFILGLVDIDRRGPGPAGARLAEQTGERIFEQSQIG